MVKKYRTTMPFAPEGRCPICGGHIFTKEERIGQVKFTMEIVAKLKLENAVKKILEERFDDIEG